MDLPHAIRALALANIPRAVVNQPNAQIYGVMVFWANGPAAPRPRFQPFANNCNLVVDDDLLERFGALTVADEEEMDVDPTFAFPAQVATVLPPPTVAFKGEAMEEIEQEMVDLPLGPPSVTSVGGPMDDVEQEMAPPNLDDRGTLTSVHTILAPPSLESKCRAMEDIHQYMGSPHLFTPHYPPAQQFMPSVIDGDEVIPSDWDYGDSFHVPSLEFVEEHSTFSSECNLTLVAEEPEDATIPSLARPVFDPGHRYQVDEENPINTITGPGSDAKTHVSSDPGPTFDEQNLCAVLNPTSDVVDCESRSEPCQDASTKRLVERLGILGQRLVERIALRKEKGACRIPKIPRRTTRTGLRVNRRRMESALNLAAARAGPDRCKRFISAFKDGSAHTMSPSLSPTACGEPEELVLTPVVSGLPLPIPSLPRLRDDPPQLEDSSTARSEIHKSALLEDTPPKPRCDPFYTLNRRIGRHAILSRITLQVEEDKPDIVTDRDDDLIFPGAYPVHNSEPELTSHSSPRPLCSFLGGIMNLIFGW